MGGEQSASPVGGVFPGDWGEFCNLRRSNREKARWAGRRGLPGKASKPVNRGTRKSIWLKLKGGGCTSDLI